MIGKLKSIKPVENFYGEFEYDNINKCWILWSCYCVRPMDYGWGGNKDCPWDCSYDEELQISDNNIEVAYEFSAQTWDYLYKRGLQYDPESGLTMEEFWDTSIDIMEFVNTMGNNYVL